VEETSQEAKEVAVQTDDKIQAETLSGPRRIERLERMEGMTSKIFAGVVVLVIAASIVAAIAT
jgi:hypothetical protein